LTVKYVPPWFPGAGFREVATNVKRLLEKNAETLFQFSVEEMVTTDAYSSKQAVLTSISNRLDIGDGPSLPSEQKHARHFYERS